MTSCAWLWMYAGLFLMLAELIVPGFVIFFFGLAAMTVGGLRFAFGDAFTLTWQLAAFSALSVLYLVFLRRFFKGIFGGSKEVSMTDLDHDSVGRIGKVTAAITAMEATACRGVSMCPPPFRRRRGLQGRPACPAEGAAPAR